MQVWFAFISKWLSWFPNLSHGYFLKYGFVVQGETLSHLESHQAGSLTHGQKVVMVWRFAWKPLERPLSPQTVKYKLHCIPGGIAAVCAMVKALKDVGVVTPATFWCNSFIWLLQTKDGSWVLENDSGIFVNLIKWWSKFQLLFQVWLLHWRKSIPPGTRCITWAGYGPSLSTKH